MYSNNKFAKMDSIANLIKTILEADTKAKMEELKGNQHKIDKNGVEDLKKCRWYLDKMIEAMEHDA